MNLTIKIIDTDGVQIGSTSGYLNPQWDTVITVELKRDQGPLAVAVKAEQTWR